MRRPRASRALATLALAGLALAGCSTDTGAPEPEDSSVNAAPVIDSDFPDPDVLEVDGTYYAFATNGNTRNVQVATSTDLESWEVLDEDALPELPSWIIPGKTWAPEVTQLADGTFVMYFTATNFSPSRQCIGVATATEPTGPFTVQGDAMLICPDAEGGAIDASTFVDDDQLFVLFKNDGNCCGIDTWLSIVPVTRDGLALAGEPQRLVMQSLPWEGELVEAPTLVEHDGEYHLFYSANTYSNDLYAIGHATADSIAGPWTKDDAPFFSTAESDGLYRGPGGQDVVTADDGSTWLVFHAWDPAFTYRGMFVDPIEWNDGTPVVAID